MVIFHSYVKLPEGTFLNLCFGGWSWWNLVNLLCGDIESGDYDMHFNVLSLIWLYLFLFMLFQLVCAYSFGFFSVNSNKRLELDNSSFGANLFFNPRLIEYFKFPNVCRTLTITIHFMILYVFSLFSRFSDEVVCLFTLEVFGLDHQLPGRHPYCWWTSH